MQEREEAEYGNDGRARRMCIRAGPGRRLPRSLRRSLLRVHRFHNRASAASEDMSEEKSCSVSFAGVIGSLYRFSDTECSVSPIA